MKIEKKLLKGSLILLIAFGIFNFLNFAFHFSMARMLSIIDYGILATLFSLIYILAVFTESIQLVIVKYASKEKDKGKLKNILKRALRKSFFVSILFFFFYLSVSIPISYFLKIDYSLIALTGVIIFSAFLPPINRGIMQGTRRFGSLGVNMVIESAIKFIFALILVYLGWNVYGAILGTVLGVLIAFLLSFFGIKDILKSNEKKVKTKGLYSYARPTFIVNLAVLLFYSLDIVLARVFFSELIAGSYAIASILAKTIFWGTQPISKAMFPLSANNILKKKKSENIFMNAFVLLIIAIFIALVLFYFFPGFIVKIFSGKLVDESIGILFYLGIATGLISLANLVLLYKLSLGKVRGYNYLLIFIIIEILLLSHFSENVFQFSVAFITSAAIFLWGSIFLVKNK